jgi:phytanoyl-CoA hydroxylase
MPRKLDFASLKPDFDRDGYVVLRGFLSADEAAEINRVIDGFIRNTVPSLPQQEIFFEVKGQPQTIKQFGHLSEREPFFNGWIERCELTRLSETLLGGPSTAKNLQWFNKPPRLGKGTPPHQDGYYFMLEPNEALTMWLALDSVDANNGCMRYIPGSHKTGLRPHGRTGTLGFSQGVIDYGFADLEREVAILAEPGDLLVHHSLTLHRADANQSERHRRALGLVYYANWAKEDRARHHAYQEKLFKELQAAGRV